MSESRCRNEAGQTLPMILMFMVCILLFAGLVIDLGQAYRTRIQLQASADAASLAGAARFPDAASANSTAYQYSARNGSKNSIPGVPNVAVAVQTKCSKTLPNCAGREHGGGRRDRQRADHVPAADRHQVDPDQGARHGLLAVQRRAAGRDVRGRPDGIDVPGLERQRAHPACPDMANARSGMMAFLGEMDSSIDRVGLTVFPPAASIGRSATRRRARTTTRTTRSRRRT